MAVDGEYIYVVVVVLFYGYVEKWYISEACLLKHQGLICLTPPIPSPNRKSIEETEVRPITAFLYFS